MKKYQKELKGFVLGFIIASLMLFNIPTFADNITQSINVVFSNIKIAINSKEIKMDKEPFTIDGTTYVPLRVVSENLGAKVNWNSKTNTIELSNTDANIAQLPNNYQVINYSDGSKYIGEVKDNKRNGFGTLFYSSTDDKERLRYDGEWKDDKREGYGTLVRTNGEKLTSLHWKNDDINDFAINDNNNGYVYAGQLKDGYYSGLGIGVEPENTFVGEWNNGVLHGYNLVIKKDGTKAVVLYDNNKATQVLNNNYSTPNIIPIYTPITTPSTTNSNNTEYLNIKKAQYEKELSDLLIQIQNVKSQLTVQIPQLQADGSYQNVYTFDQTRVDQLQRLYDAKLSNFNAWKASNGIK